MNPTPELTGILKADGGLWWRRKRETRPFALLGDPRLASSTISISILLVAVSGGDELREREICSLRFGRREVSLAVEQPSRHRCGLGDPRLGFPSVVGLVLSAAFSVPYTNEMLFSKRCGCFPTTW